MKVERGGCALLAAGCLVTVALAGTVMALLWTRPATGPTVRWAPVGPGGPARVTGPATAALRVTAGPAAAGGHVILSGPTGFTFAPALDETGSVSVADLEPGEWDVRVSAGASRNSSMPAGEVELVADQSVSYAIELPGDRAVEGALWLPWAGDQEALFASLVRVEDPELPCATMLLPRGPSFPRSLAQGDFRRGEFRVEGLAPGVYELRVHAGIAEERITAEVDLRDGDLLFERIEVTPQDFSARRRLTLTPR